MSSSMHRIFWYSFPLGLGVSVRQSGSEHQGSDWYLSCILERKGEFPEESVGLLRGSEEVP